MDYGYDWPPKPEPDPEPTRWDRFYDTVAVPAVNFTCRWLSRTAAWTALTLLVILLAGR